jgi:hypothetical protein
LEHCDGEVFAAVMSLLERRAKQEKRAALQAEAKARLG